MINLLAQKEEPLGGFLQGEGPLGLETGPLNISEATGLLNKIISVVVGVMTIVAGLWFIFQFIIGAWGYLTAGGNQEAVTNASKKIMNALLGLVVVVAAIFLIEVVGVILGLEILTPGDFITGIW